MAQPGSAQSGSAQPGGLGADTAGTWSDYDLKHHGDAETAPGLVDLAVNVRGPAPAWLRAELHAAVDSLTSYPDPARATAAVVAGHHRRREEVLLTAGAAEAFVLLARALKPCHAVVVHPQFTEPEAALRAAGHAVDRLVLAPPFRFDPARIPPDADLVVIGNPTNPTSVLHPAADLLALARPGRVLLVDEAFMDAVPGETESLAGPRGAGVPGLVVTRSLTKTWGLAGLRIGYLVGDPDVLRACAAAQPLWSVNTLALAAAIGCSRPAAVAEAERLAVHVAADREYLIKTLQALPDVEVATPAAAPFVLIRTLGPDPAGVHGRLRAAGWAVRRADTFPGLQLGWLRVAVRDPATSDAFAAALHVALTPALTSPLTSALSPALTSPLNSARPSALTAALTSPLTSARTSARTCALTSAGTPALTSAPHPAETPEPIP